MNYSNIYIKLCRRGKHRKYDSLIHEKHHAFPRFMFGDNDSLVSLTLREHFLVHLLLVRIIRQRYGKEHPFYLGALRSVFVMSVNGKGKTNSRIYESFRIDYVNSMRGKNWGYSPEKKRQIMTENNPMKRPEIAQKVSLSIKEKWANGDYVFTSERNEKVRQGKLGSKNPMFGKSEASAHLNVKNHMCTHCGIITTKGNISRWHNTRCRSQAKT